MINLKIEDVYKRQEVDHMSPCMTGNQKTLDPDPVDVDDLIVVQQHFFIVNRDLRQLIEMINNLAACFSCLLYTSRYS